MTESVPVSTLRRRRRRVVAGGGVLALALVAGTAGCSSGLSGSSGAGSSGKTTITVAGMPATTSPKTRQQFLDAVAAFEKANPKIKVKPTDTQWDARTFAARLAGGNAETVLTVPLTEPPGLIARKQIADLGAELEALPHSGDLDPRALAPATAADGRVFGLPVTEYALGLVYNRDLFTKAGLDPDKPPTTWDEVRTAAKKISDTGVTGYTQMTVKNTGGWILTAMTYGFGGSMEKKVGDTYVPALLDGPAEKALGQLAAMRWQDDSMGNNHLRTQQDAERDFAAGKIGMMISTVNSYNRYITQYSGKPADFGMAALPQQNGGRSTLLGGLMAVVSAKATPAQRTAAVKWIDYFYLKPAYDPAAAEEQAVAQAADKLAVGLPTLPFYSAAVSDPVNVAIGRHTNIPTGNFAPYVAGVGKLEYQVEPPVAAQELYGALDTAVQAVLTRKDADPRAELAKAADRLGPVVEKAQAP
ncbi:ABC transporter substrate-binding protein [Embleya scabrispora]|uniref:ABC transporter substrate-binding protein n=1 Tax=Embleya scabrispora TaxID=159449 RepID=UPI00117E4F9D|nr:extracellular solute-binding protein [Embleya scabrispora]